jgi:hypothetical protein
MRRQSGDAVAWPRPPNRLMIPCSCAQYSPGAAAAQGVCQKKGCKLLTGLALFFLTFRSSGPIFGVWMARWPMSAGVSRGKGDEMMQASPTKLRSGEWGAKVQGAPKVGDEITIQTRGGKSWTAQVTRIIWSGDDVAICATSSSSGRPEPTTLDGRTAIRGQHWSSRGRGPVERLCAGGCGRRVDSRYASCYGCNREELDAM